MPIWDRRVKLASRATATIIPGISAPRLHGLHARLTTGPGRNGLRGRGFVELDVRHVAPEVLEPVVRARGRREDVHDDVEVVGDDPLSVALAVGRARDQIL